MVPERAGLLTKIHEEGAGLEPTLQEQHLPPLLAHEWQYGPKGHGFVVHGDGTLCKIVQRGPRLATT